MRCLKIKIPINIHAIYRPSFTITCVDGHPAPAPRLAPAAPGLPSLIQSSLKVVVAMPPSRRQFSTIPAATIAPRPDSPILFPTRITSATLRMENF